VRYDYFEKNGELTQTWRSTHSSQNFQLEVKYCLDGHFEKRKTFCNMTIGSFVTIGQSAVKESSAQILIGTFSMNCQSRTHFYQAIF
jgi:hypothetical protein